MSTEKLVDRHGVREITAISPAYMYELIGKGLFPRPIRCGKRSFWLHTEILSWIEGRRNERDAAK